MSQRVQNAELDRGEGGPALARSRDETEDWSNADLESFLDATPNLICAVGGADHVVELASEAVRQLVGDRPIVGRRLRDALPELASEELLRAIDAVHASGASFRRHEVTVWFHEIDGGISQRYLDLVGKPIQSRVRGSRLVAVFAQDVTELVIARKTAESASRAKDEFLAMLGHELRNPLAPIRTALELLRGRNDAPVPRELQVIERQVEHLVGLVDDLLDVSRISRGRIELRRETVDLGEVIQSAIEMVTPLIDKREHQLSVRMPRRELWVDGDRARLTQIFVNLLTNSAKFCEPRGQITVHAEVVRGMQVVVRVGDDGAGIAPELLPRVFHLFEQGRQTLDRAMGGLGLGLAIVRSLVLLHGGEVSASSGGVGRGAELTVSLPVAEEPTERTARPPERRPEPIHTGGARLRVLVVDDNEDAADLIAVALAIAGHETATANDGPTALETAGWFQPHVAVLDIGLPMMDGCELARRMRELPELASIRLVAVTGYGQDSDRQRSRAAGFDAHLLKPIEMSDLHEAIDGRQTFSWRAPVDA